MTKQENNLGASLAAAFADERAFVDRLLATALELPMCKDVAVGKEVKLKYHLLIWKEIGVGKWTEYTRTKQVIEHTKPIGDGGFDFSWELTDATLSYRVHGSFAGHTLKSEGSLPVSAYRKCDECDDGRRNNQTELRDTATNGGKLDTWPKNRDRVRLVITDDEGKKHEVEIDTKE